MSKLTIDVPEDLAQQITRMVRDGWFPDEQAVFREALAEFIDSKSFLGDSPAMLHRFAADALNDGKAETALKFVDRGLSLARTRRLPDLSLYQMLVELRVHILLVMNRQTEAVQTLEEARQRLPNNPSIAGWLERLRK